MHAAAPNNAETSCLGRLQAAGLQVLKHLDLGETELRWMSDAEMAERHTAAMQTLVSNDR